MTTTDRGAAKLVLTVVSIAATLAGWLVLAAREDQPERREGEASALPPLPALGSVEERDVELAPFRPRRRPAPVATTRSSR
jgi:hypothetical protein